MLSECWRSSGIGIVAGSVVAGFHCSYILIASKHFCFENIHKDKNFINLIFFGYHFQLFLSLSFHCELILHFGPYLRNVIYQLLNH